MKFNEIIINATIKALREKIDNYWFLAEIDYGIRGGLKDITVTQYTSDDMMAVIEWVEEGTTYCLPIHYITDHTAETLYNIWMETDWSFYATETEIA